MHTYTHDDGGIMTKLVALVVPAITYDTAEYGQSLMKL